MQYQDRAILRYRNDGKLQYSETGCLLIFNLLWEAQDFCVKYWWMTSSVNALLFESNAIWIPLLITFAFKQSMHYFKAKRLLARNFKFPSGNNQQTSGVKRQVRWHERERSSFSNNFKTFDQAKLYILSKPKFNQNSIVLNLRLDYILTARSTHHPTPPHHKLSVVVVLARQQGPVCTTIQSQTS